MLLPSPSVVKICMPTVCALLVHISALQIVDYAEPYTLQ